MARFGRLGEPTQERPLVVQNALGLGVRQNVKGLPHGMPAAPGLEPVRAQGRPVAAMQTALEGRTAGCQTTPVDARSVQDEPWPALL